MIDNIVGLFDRKTKKEDKPEYVAFLGEIDDGRNEIEFEIHAVAAPNATRYTICDLPFTVEHTTKVFPLGHTDQEVRQWAKDEIQRHVKCRVTIV
jgi:hypothetical protein